MASAYDRIKASRRKFHESAGLTDQDIANFQQNYVASQDGAQLVADLKTAEQNLINSPATVRDQHKALADYASAMDRVSTFVGLGGQAPGADSAYLQRMQEQYAQAWNNYDSLVKANRQGFGGLGMQTAAGITPGGVQVDQDALTQRLMPGRGLIDFDTMTPTASNQQAAYNNALRKQYQNIQSEAGQEAARWSEQTDSAMSELETVQYWQDVIRKLPQGDDARIVSSNQEWMRQAAEATGITSYTDAADLSSQLAARESQLRAKSGWSGIMRDRNAGRQRTAMAYEYQMDNPDESIEANYYLALRDQAESDLRHADNFVEGMGDRAAIGDWLRYNSAYGDQLYQDQKNADLLALRTDANLSGIYQGALESTRKANEAGRLLDQAKTEVSDYGGVGAKTEQDVRALAETYGIPVTGGDDSLIAVLEQIYQQQMHTVNTNVARLSAQGYDGERVQQYIEQSLSEQSMDEYTAETRAYAQENPGAASVKSSFANLLSGGGYLSAAPQAFTNAMAGITGNYENYVPIDTNDESFAFTQYVTSVRDEVAKNIVENGGDDSGYNVSMSILDNMVQMAVGAMTFGAFGASSAAGKGARAVIQAGIQSSAPVTLATMGIGAASQELVSLTEQGVSSDQAYALATVKGALEIVTERIGIDNLVSNIGKQYAGNMLQQIVGMAAKQSAAEGTEEIIAEAGGLFADWLIRQDESEIMQTIEAGRRSGLTEDEALWQAFKQYGMQVLEAGEAGALSGLFFGAMSTVGVAADAISPASTGARIRAEGNEEALGAIATAYGIEYSPNMSDRQVGKTYRAVQKAAGRLQQDLQQGMSMDTYAQEKGYDAKTTRALNRSWDAYHSVYGNDMSSREFAATWNSMKAAGQANMGFADAVSELGETTLSQATLQNAWKSGQRLYNQAQKAAQKVAKNAPVAAQENVQQPTESAATLVSEIGESAPAQTQLVERSSESASNHARELMDERINVNGLSDDVVESFYDEVDSDISTERRGALSVARMLTGVSKNISQVILVDNATTDAEGHVRLMSNGMWDPTNRTITIDINAGVKNVEQQMTFMTRAMSHEITHSIKTTAPKQYAELERFVLREMDKKISLDKMIEAKIEGYAKEGIELDRQGAIDELVAESCEQMLERTDVLNKLAQENKTLWEKIKDYIKSAIQKLKNLYKGMKANSPEARMLQGVIDELQRKWDAAFAASLTAETAETTGDNQHSIAGRNAEIANIIALDEAKQMEVDGYSESEIYQQTGWFRGADNMWRFEIDDSTMRYTPERMAQKMVDGTVHLEDVIDHPVLFAAYPRLRDVSVTFTPMKPGAEGVYRRAENRIYLADSNKNSPESTLVHEIQHAIQALEGFAYGASRAYWANIINNGGKIDSKRLRDATAAVRKFEGNKANQPVIDARNRLEDAYDKSVRDGNAMYAQMQVDGMATKVDTYDDLLIEQSNAGVAYLNSLPIELYMNTAGEQEARDVAERRTMTAEQRKAKMPQTGTKDTVFVEGSAVEKVGVQIDTATKSASPVQYQINRGERMAKLFDNGGVELNEYEVAGALWDAMDHGDAGDDNLIRIGQMPKYVTNLLGITGDFYIYRNHSYENMVSKEDAIAAGRPIVRNNKNIHFHELGVDGLTDAIMSVETPLITIKESKKTPEISMILPVMGKNNAPLYAVLRFYDSQAVKGRFTQRPHILLTVSDRPYKNTDGRIGTIDVVRKAYEERRIIDMVKDKKMRDSLSVIAQSIKLGNITEASLNASLTQFRKEIKDFKDENKIYYQISRDTASNMDLLMGASMDGLSKAEADHLLRYRDRVNEIRQNQRKIDELKTEELTADVNAQIKRLENANSIIYRRVSSAEQTDLMQRIIERERAAGDVEVQRMDNRVADLEDEIDELEQKIRNAKLAGQMGQGRRDAAVLRKTEERLTKRNEKQKQAATEKAAKQKQQAAERAEAQKQKATERLDAQKAKTDRLLGELMGTLRTKRRQLETAKRVRDERIAQMQESHANEREARKRSVLVHKIRNVANDLRQRTLRPTDGRYVPSYLTRAVIDVANMIDDAPGEGTKARAKYDSMQAALRNLRYEYDNLEKDKDPDYNSEYDREFAILIDELANAIGDTAVKDMTYDQVEDVYSVLRDIRITLIDAVHQIGSLDRRTNYDTGVSIIEEMQAVAPRKKVLGDIKTHMDGLAMSPLRNVHKMTGYQEDSTLMALFDDLNTGIRRQNKFVMEANQMFDPLREGKLQNTFAAACNDVVDFELLDIDGKPVKMTRMDAMQIVLSFERERANEDLIHMEANPVNIADPVLMRKGKVREAISQGQMVSIGLEQIKMIESKLTEWDKQFMDKARELFNGKAKDAINETSRLLKHRNLATGKAYIPFHVDQNFVNREIEGVKVDSTIEGAGSLKSLSKKATQPLLITGLNHVIDEHIGFVGKYYGLAVPIRNFNKAYNIKKVGSTLSVKSAIDNVWGRTGLNVIESAVRDLQKSRERATDALSKGLQALQSGFVKAALLSNVSVTIKQASSYYSAGLHLSQLALARYQAAVPRLFAAPNGSYAKNLYAEIDKHTAQHWIRRQGMSTQELGENAQRKGKLADFERKLPASLNPVKWIQNMDVATTGALWLACKKEIQNSGVYETNSEEYWSAVTELYDRTIEETQGMYDVLHRPEVQKTTNELVRQLIMFRTEPLQHSGLLYDSFGELAAAKKSGDEAWRKRAALKARRAVGSQVASMTVFAVMTMIAGMVTHRLDRYRDEDEELTVLSVMLTMLGDIGQDAFGKLIPVGGSEIYDVIVNKLIGSSRFETVSVPVVGVINDYIDAMTTVRTAFEEQFESDEPDWGAAWSTVYALGKKTAELFGIPVTNVENILVGTYKNALDIANGYFPAINNNVDRSAGVNYRRLYAALADGDTEKFDAVYEELTQDLTDSGEDDVERTIASGLQQEIKAAYLDGDITEEQATDFLVRYTIELSASEEQQHNTGTITDEEYMTMLENEAYWIMKGWRAKDEDPEASDSRYADLQAVIEAGGDGTAAIEELLEHGETEDEIRSGASGIIAELYKNGEIDATTAEAYLAEYAGITDSKALYTWFTEKDHWVETGESDYGAYGPVWDAIIEGGDVDGAIDAMVDAGWTEIAVAEEIRTRAKEWVLGTATDGYTISTDEARNILSKYGGVDDDDLDMYIDWYDFQMENPGYADDFSMEAVQKYNEYGSGIGLDVYADFMDATGEMEADIDPDTGKSISGSKKAKVMDYIDAMPISDEQKDQLYYAAGYKQSTIYEAPWH